MYTPHQFNAQTAMPSGNLFDTSNQDIGAQGVSAINYNVEIVALNLQETGTYNDQFTRSYQASMPHETVNDILAAVAQGQMNTRPGVFASLASNVLDVNARVNPAEDLIKIPNGWGVRRFRFLLQVRESSFSFPGSVYYTYIQGFSEATDVSLQSGLINPEMRFFINNFVRIIEMMQNTPNGPRKAQRVQSSGQVINGALVSNQMPTQYMRPSDIMGRLQTDADSELRSGDVFDVRNTNIGGSNSALSHFSNNTATQYMSRLITPMVDSIKSIGFGPGNGTVIDTATANSLGAEPSYHDSPFMTLLQRRHHVVGAASFSMTELANLDPTVGTRTKLTPVAKEYQGGLAARGNSEEWNTATLETVFATKLINAIPGFMWQAYIGSVSFSMSNSLSGGVVELRLQNLVPVTSFAPPEYVQQFLTNVQEMLARDISYNNQLVFDVFVNASIIGDIHLNVSINGGSPVPYCAPAFGSGVLNPMYTHNPKTFDRLAHGMRSVLDGLECVYKESKDFSQGSFNSNI